VKVITFFVAAGTTREQTAVQTDVFLDQLQDLSAWAVREAVRRWFSHDAATYPGAQFRFRLSAGDLHHAAQGAVSVASGQIILLQRILDAQPADERTPDERAAVLARLRNLKVGPQPMDTREEPATVDLTEAAQ
jgi:hypothetical protein